MFYHTGYDVCPQAIYTQNELHVNGDVAYATQQYIAATWDKEFLLNERGYELVTGLADFWATRSEFDKIKKAYVIKGRKSFLLNFVSYFVNFLTGYDVCPAEGPSKYELHVNGDIAYATQQYIAATWDKEFLLKEKGYELVRDLADFWASRSQFDKTKKAYVIKGRRE